MRTIMIAALITTISLSAFSQTAQKTDSETQSQNQTYSYVYISIKGKGFSNKLKVVVDFGDTPEQIKMGREYSEILTNKKSYAAVLNYLGERRFELVETRDDFATINGTGETRGIFFIMRRKK